MNNGDNRSFTCPRCGGHTKVIDSNRAASEEIAIRRARKCKECGHRVYTIERIHREMDAIKTDFDDMV